MAFNIQPCEPTDVAELVDVFYAAFAKHNPIADLMADIPIEIMKQRDIDHHVRSFRD